MRGRLAAVVISTALAACGGGSESSAKKTKATDAAQTATTLPGGLTLPTGIGSAGAGRLGNMGDGLVCAVLEATRRRAEDPQGTDDQLREQAKSLSEFAKQAQDAAIRKAAEDGAAAAERLDRAAVIQAADAGRERCKATLGSTNP